LNWGSRNIVKMAQDIVADALNQIMNAKRVGKTTIEIARTSKLLINLLGMMKKDGYVDFERVDNGDGKPKIVVTLIKINECKAVKPRYYADVDSVEKYLRRFLPSRNFGSLIVSTNKGLMNHKQAIENKLGGAIIAYFY
jgi:small subunit ribosomal protein S8